MLRFWRSHCDARAKQTVLVLGDSHVRVFEDWRFMWHLPQIRWHTVYVPGGTATGLYNPRSITQSYSRFKEGLAQTDARRVILCLGEVDAGYRVWVQAEKSQKPPEDLLKRAINNYLRFIQEIAAERELIVLSAPLPTLPDTFVPGSGVLSRRASLPISQLERTTLTLAFNSAVKQRCAEWQIPYLDDRHESLGPDGLIKPDWLNSKRLDHHYGRPRYSRFLLSQLPPLLKQP